MELYLEIEKRGALTLLRSLCYSGEKTRFWLQKSAPTESRQRNKSNTGINATKLIQEFLVKGFQPIEIFSENRITSNERHAHDTPQ